MTRSPPDMDVLYLISYEFPFGKGETFLETEVNYLAETFEKVVVIPSRACFSKSWRNKVAGEIPRKIPSKFELWLPSEDDADRTLPAIASGLRILGRARFRRLLQFGSVREIFRETMKAALFYQATRDLFSRVGSNRVAYTYWKSSATIALCAAKDFGFSIPVVTRAHRVDLYYDQPHHPTMPYDPLVSRNATIIGPVSEDGFSHLVKHGFPIEKLRLLRLGVSLPLADTVGSSDGILRIVSCSTLTPVKRVTLLAEAFGHLTVPFEWTHFGDGPDFNEIVEITSHYPTHGRVFLPGRVSNQFILDFYRSKPVDCLVNLSSSEGVPVSIMEALAAGIPCFATDAGGTSEIVDVSVGCLFDLSVSAQSVADELERFAKDNASMSLKRVAARQRARDRCDASRLYSEFAQELLRLAQTSRL